MTLTEKHTIMPYHVQNLMLADSCPSTFPFPNRGMVGDFPPEGVLHDGGMQGFQASTLSTWR